MLDVKVAKLKNTGEIMEANNKLEEVNTEPVIQLIIPGGSGQEKVVSVTRKKAMTLAGIFAVVFICMAAGSIIIQKLIGRRIRNILIISRSRTQRSSRCWMTMKRCCGI